MRGEYRKIDFNLRQGLHELASSGAACDSFRFQLAYAMRQTNDILDNLDSLVTNTINKAPKREGKFCLDRVKATKLTHEEDKWERAMHKKWGPKGSGEFVPFCKRIQTYQYPLQTYRTASQPAPNNTSWGEIDLIGIGIDFLPVPIELKKREAVESPLRMLVEVAAYGFAIRVAWPKLRNHWIEAVSWFGGSPSQFPATLDRIALVGVAPEEYWCQCLGNKAGAFPSETWPPFWKLVDAIGERGFDIHFVSIKGSFGKKAKRVTITGARELDRTLKPGACHS